MEKFGSDKSTWHNYTKIYSEIFKNFINKNINIFELGLGTNNLDIPSNMGLNGKPGASLRAWNEFFKNANVYGGDIDKRILFNENNIKTYYVDQYSISDIKNLWNNDDLKNIEFDIIIDDGIHESNGTFIFLKNSFYKVKKNGYFIIEDIPCCVISEYKDKLNDYSKDLNFTFDILDLSNSNNMADNVLAILIKQ
jgi:hypothetical protein